MHTYWLCFTLLSDATFGRGEGLAGLVNQDVTHEENGLPYLKGRTLKGLLNEECANIRYALEKQSQTMKDWHDAAQRLFGGPGSTLADNALLNVGRARLPQDVRTAVSQTPGISAVDVLDALTAIRRQTAVNETSGAPEDHALRALRVILRQTPFEARLTFRQDPAPYDLPLLAACVLALRRTGTGRNRGRGRLRATLHTDQDGGPGKDITQKYFTEFAKEVAE